MEIRSYGNEAAPKLLDERIIEGFGVVFNKESRVLYDPEKKRFFIEIIEPGAITQELLRECDIKALIEHNRQRLLARSNLGEGSLTLEIAEYGLKYRFSAPNTDDGNFALEMIRRGDLFGSSFAYTTDEKKNVTYKQRNGLLIRRVHKIDKMFDIAIVSDPAYFGTDVTTRSIEPYEDTTKEKDYKIQIEKLRLQI